LGVVGCVGRVGFGDLPLCGGLVWLYWINDMYGLWDWGWKKEKKGTSSKRRWMPYLCSKPGLESSLCPCADPEHPWNAIATPPAKTTRCKRRRKRRVAAWTPRQIPAIPVTESARGPVTMPCVLRQNDATAPIGRASSFWPTE
jgi:hypothetical protein